MSSMRDILSKGVYKIRFLKKDGTIRNMICTRDFDSLTKMSEGFEIPSKAKSSNPYVTPVFDLGINEFRSFRNSSIMKVKYVSSLEDYLASKKKEIKGTE